MQRIIRVDMSTKQVRVDKVDEYKLLGGRALTSRITYDEVQANCEPLGRENKLIIAPGLLAGTAVSSGSRISVGGKSPLTNGIKEANCGGISGAKLARCGIKAIIVEGKSYNENAYVLKIDKEGIELIAYNSLKLLGTYRTAAKLRETYGQKVGILCVGPGGERGLRAAAIASNDPFGELKFAARGGMGAVMGSKGLKAIVVNDEGVQPMEYHDKDKFMGIAKDFNRQLMMDPKTKEIYQRVGTSGIVKAVNAMGALPTKNFRYGSWEHAEELSGEKLYETVAARGGKGKTGIPCMNGCVIKCSNVYPDADGEGIVSTLQYENIALLGSNLGFDNLDAVARLNREVNDLGLDTIEIGAALGVALDEGLGEFGDEAGCMALLNEIRRNTVLGKVLGNGALITGQVLGSDRIPTAKGQGFPGYDPRALKGNGVTYAMSPMGADHTAGNCFGARNEVDPLGKENQGKLSKDLQRRMATLDSLGFCIFARVPLFKDLSILPGLVNALLGSDFDEENIWDVGHETVSIEREFNVKAGISPAQDRLPEFCYYEELQPVKSVFDLPREEMEKAVIE
ncbi:MAG: aldehyde ferredoxin oxidoreductase [Firmicutes bacterium]|nr:aldehyde ferredoxin oxidoreductase C-terminal domain-containing protein [Bacillota bacterium]NSW91401.1 aldehyde ferredoxin oxidoreductase [Bacillota bacterium]